LSAALYFASFASTSAPLDATRESAPGELPMKSRKPSMTTSMAPIISLVGATRQPLTVCFLASVRSSCSLATGPAERYARGCFLPAPWHRASVPEQAHLIKQSAEVSPCARLRSPPRAATCYVSFQKTAAPRASAITSINTSRLNPFSLLGHIRFFHGGKNMNTNHSTPSANPPGDPTTKPLKAWADRTVRRALYGDQLLPPATPPAADCC
jgi:hypothetical protein